MSLVYLKNKKSNVTYVYECISFWNKEKKRPDSTRTCIGKLDPTSGIQRQLGWQVNDN